MFLPAQIVQHALAICRQTNGLFKPETLHTPKCLRGLQTNLHAAATPGRIRTGNSALRLTVKEILKLFLAHHVKRVLNERYLNDTEREESMSPSRRRGKHEHLPPAFVKQAANAREGLLLLTSRHPVPCDFQKDACRDNALLLGVQPGSAYAH